MDNDAEERNKRVSGRTGFSFLQHAREPTDFISSPARLAEDYYIEEEAKNGLGNCVDSSRAGGVVGSLLKQGWFCKYFARRGSCFPNSRAPSTPEQRSISR